MDRLDGLIDSYRDDMIETLKQWVHIPSKQADALPGKPFGEALHTMLKAALDKAETMGFETCDVDGYAGHVDFGKGEKTLGILVHLDVVPEGDGWSVDPYGGVIKDGAMYGRGTTDNKASAVGSLFALKAIKEAGIPLKDGVRLIFGLNEESGWEDIAYYKTKYKMPDYGYSPDGPFPLVYAEKGIMNVELSGTFEKGEGEYPILSIKAGTALNVVPDTCVGVLGAKDPEGLAKKLSKVCEEMDIPHALKAGEGEVALTVTGKAAHGSTPKEGVNAALLLLKAFAAIGAGQGSKDTVAFLADHVGPDGEGLNADVKDEPSGPLTMNLGLFELDEKGFTANLDIRQPVTYSFDEVVGRIAGACAPYGVKARDVTHKDPLHLPLDHPIIVTLMGIYKEITGRDDKPTSMGGGTYARALDNAVAFGPGFPGDERSTGAHMSDEHQNIEDWIMTTKLYAHAIVALAQKGIEL